MKLSQILLRALIPLGTFTVAFPIAFTEKVNAQVVSSPFDSFYSATDLGSITGLPSSYGGLTFKLGDPNTLLIGGNANSASGLLYEAGLIRDANNKVIGFSGTPTPFGTVGEFNDGGVVYGPNNVLFTARYPNNQLGQTKVGSTDEDRIDNLATLGIGGGSPGGVNFVPTGFSGAGRMKVSTFGSGNWYDVSYSPDGSGTFNLDSATQIDLDLNTPGIQSLPGGPEGFVYVAAGNAGFTVDSLLVSEYSAGLISAYQLDALGNPLLATRQDFITEVSGAEGAAIDPLTGDFFFSTFGSGNRVIRVSGFKAPSQPVPEPTSIVSFLALGILGAGSTLKNKFKPFQFIRKS